MKSLQEEIIEIRVIIDRILRDQTEADRDLEKLAGRTRENQARNTDSQAAIYELERTVGALRALAFLLAGLGLGTGLLALGFWVIW